jgi:hypothetical protein
VSAHKSQSQLRLPELDLVIPWPVKRFVDRSHRNHMSCIVQSRRGLSGVNRCVCVFTSILIHPCLSPMQGPWSGETKR